MRMALPTITLIASQMTRSYENELKKTTEEAVQ
jgi:hypothetical protein